MTYWSILQQRRKDLGLTIDDVSRETRVAPEYIAALENNDLFPFRDNLAYVAVLVQNYCNAIGVNYWAIDQDVQSNLASYAKRKNLSLQAAPARVSTSPAVKKKPASPSTRNRKGTRKKSTKSSNVQKNSAAARRKAKRQRQRRRRISQLIFILGVIMLIALLGINTWMEGRDAAERMSEEQKRQQELAEKEAETQKLADQKKNSQNQTDDSLEITSYQDGSNTFIIRDLDNKVTALKFSIQLPEESTVKIYVDDTLVTSEGDARFSGDYTTTVSVVDGSVIVLEIGTYADGAITVNGQTVEFDKQYWAAGQPAVLTFHFEKVTAEPNVALPGQSDTETETEESHGDGTAQETADDENVFTGNYDYSQGQ